MILSFKTRFPDGTPTQFAEKINAAFTPKASEIPPKMHTLREDKKNRWKEGNHIHMATGVRSKNYLCFYEGKCTGVQDIKIEFWESHKVLRVTVDSRTLNRREINQLITNDGLNVDRFIEWFFPKGRDGVWEGKIIHWTDFRY